MLQQGATVQGMIIGADQALEAALAVLGVRHGTPARLLLNAEAAPDPAAVIARCEAFAQTAAGASDAGASNALVVTLLRPSPTGQAGQVAAGALHAFTRWAGLAWASRGVRTCLLQAEATVPPDEIARMVIGLAALPSMTGQRLRLG